MRAGVLRRARAHGGAKPSATRLPLRENHLHSLREILGHEHFGVVVCELDRPFAVHPNDLVQLRQHGDHGADAEEPEDWGQPAKRGITRDYTPFLLIFQGTTLQ